MSGLSNLREAYQSVYDQDLRTEIDEDNQLSYIDDLTDDEIDEVVLQVAEELNDFGYSLSESTELFDEFIDESLLMEMNPYAPAGSKEARAYGKATSASKKSKERSDKRAARVQRIKGAVKRVASGSREVARKVGEKIIDTASKVKTAAKKKLASTLRSAASPGGSILKARRAVNQADRNISKAKQTVKTQVKKASAAVSAGKAKAVSFANRAASRAETGAKNLANRLDPAGAPKPKKPKMAKEAHEVAYVLATQLVEEGFAKDFHGAMIMLGNMTQEYIQSMIEEYYA